MFKLHAEKSHWVYFDKHNLIEFHGNGFKLLIIKVRWIYHWKVGMKNDIHWYKQWLLLSQFWNFYVHG